MMSIFSRLFRRGTSLAPAQAVTAIANRPMIIAPRNLAAMISSAQSMPDRTGWCETDEWEPHGSKPDHLIAIKDGVGVIAVRGPLFQRWDIYAWFWGGTGYDVIVAAAQQLGADAGVREIVLDLDSPGGQCSGCWDAIDALRVVGAQKPITAVINDDGFSACYALATSAKRIVVTRTGGAGSCGVRWTHVDVSKLNERWGVTFTEVVSGAKKAQMSPNAPLSSAAQDEMQVEVDRLAAIFFEYVAAARPLTAEQVSAMEAGIYFGPGAVAAGLCDEIGTLDSVLAGLAQATASVGDNPAPTIPAPDAAVPVPAPTATVSTQDSPVDALSPMAAGAPVPVVTPAAILPITFDAAVAASALPAAIKDALTRRGTAKQAPDVAIKYAGDVRDACFAAGVETLATDFIAANTDIAMVRSKLVELKAAGGVEIVTAHPPGESTKQAEALAQRLNPTAVYAKYNARKKP